MPETLRRCCTCRQMLVRAEFTPRSHGGGLHSECRTCACARTRRGRQARPKVRGRPRTPATLTKAAKPIATYVVMSTPCGPLYPWRVFTAAELRAALRADRLAIGALVERDDGARLVVMAAGTLEAV